MSKRAKKDRKRKARKKRQAENARQRNLRRGCPRCEYTKVVKGICPGTTQCLGCFKVVEGPKECIGCEVEFASRQARLDRGCPLYRKRSES